VGLPLGTAGAVTAVAVLRQLRFGLATAALISLVCAVTALADGAGH
jgi:hypothetical protein